MKPNPNPRVVEAERMDNGVIITFDDGKYAIYPASLLYATFAKAEQSKEDAQNDGGPATLQEDFL
jgi:hypothetical protein